jgi:hypothetical protein
MSRANTNDVYDGFNAAPVNMTEINSSDFYWSVTYPMIDSPEFYTYYAADPASQSGRGILVAPEDRTVRVYPDRRDSRVMA